MSILIGFLYVIEVLACLLLALVVMLQKPKEGGLGGAIAGGMGEAVFGADASNVLIKVTIWLGAIFLANTLLLARLTSKVSNSVTDGISEAPVEQQQPALPQGGDVAPAPAPAAPTVPAKPDAKPAAPAAPAAPAKPVAPAPAAPAKPVAAPAPTAPAKPAAAPAPATPAKPAAPAPAPAPAAPAKPAAPAAK
ncbi:MAG: preprotein translocase subunit SecG [Kiritimatiellae bacterium]|nr:preprotein translocase subunit SecG [Kiritimatiellia bacterium]